jgi:hypothetical protein
MEYYDALGIMNDTFKRALSGQRVTLGDKWELARRICKEHDDKEISEAGGCTECRSRYCEHITPEMKLIQEQYNGNT